MNTNISVDDDVQLSETPRKNNSATATNDHVFLGSDSTQYQDNHTNNMKYHKLPPPGNIILVLKFMGKVTGKHSVPNHVH